MPHHLDHETRGAMFATLTTAVAVDGGPTPEQQRFLDAVGSHVFGVTDAPAPLGPDAAAVALPDPEVRRIVTEGLIVLELMRHPASAELGANVEAYLEALGGDHEEQVLVRDCIAEARDRVVRDWDRMQEPTKDEQPLVDADEDEIVRQLRSLADLPPGSLGRSFADFYARHGFPLPVDHLSLVAHDFAHVLAGYEATPEGELALQAMLVASTRGRFHFSGLMASMLLFEVGLLPFPDIEPKVAVLDRPGAAELFAEAIMRGADTDLDFQNLDHFALASRDLAEIRTELGLPAPTDGPFTFVV